jgi:hypothetical protein
VMKAATLETLAPLLKFLRSYEVLGEANETKFLLKGRDFIHFHDEPEGLWADVKLSKGRVRVSVSTASEQSELMEKVAKKLDALESHKRHGKSRGTQRYGRDA